ncbi:MAG: DUF190 domain-containing protein [Gammaproteobacteria bacterium]|nr:DUF190 domain-containing protein [Gammaproteobacteria bacterium]
MKVRGISVVRDISGFGESRNHTSSLVGLSLDLPLIIESLDLSDQRKFCLFIIGRISIVLPI